MDEADEVATFIPMLDWSERAFAVHTPNLAEDRLEPNAMFVDGPQLHRVVWECRCDLAQQLA
jgi:hypothetical protein